jgi:hypothetical protein
MKFPDDILISHVLLTLPDSMALRKTLLRAVLHKISSAHPQYKTVLAMLGSLQRHEDLQAKLGLRAKPHHDGDGHYKKGDGK